jgi:hypothetical protein
MLRQELEADRWRECSADSNCFGDLGMLFVYETVILFAELSRLIAISSHYLYYCLNIYPVSFAACGIERAT